MFIFDTLLLQTSGGAGTLNIVFFAAMLLIFWLFLIRPQAKKQREQSKFMSGLKVGDEVVTASGILGKINRLDKGDIISLEVGPKVFIRVTKNAISKEMTESVYATMAKSKDSDDKDKKQED